MTVAGKFINSSTQMSLRLIFVCLGRQKNDFGGATTDLTAQLWGSEVDFGTELKAFG